jgi:hypothetical protein
MDGKGVALLHLLRGQRLEGFEKSFKMSAGSLLCDRFLAGIHKSDLSPPSLFALCAGMGMPEKYVRALKQNAEGANAFHFGFEGTPERSLYKVYLEFAGELRRQDCDPVLLHIAYKWDGYDPGLATIAKYVCHQGLSSRAIVEKTAVLYRGDIKAFEAVRSMLEIASMRTSEPPMYLEVTEEGNPRASFDVKLHDAGIRVRDIAPLLITLREHFGIPADSIDALLERIKERPVGHLSGGINREGKDFLTVYYAAEPP